VQARQALVRQALARQALVRQAPWDPVRRVRALRVRAPQARVPHANIDSSSRNIKLPEFESILAIQTAFARMPSPFSANVFAAGNFPFLMQRKAPFYLFQAISNR
jgi:hypothetical protein